MNIIVPRVTRRRLRRRRWSALAVDREGVRAALADEPGGLTHGGLASAAGLPPHRVSPAVLGLVRQGVVAASVTSSGVRLYHLVECRPGHPTVSLPAGTGVVGQPVTA